ncbi:MAG: spore coat protein CotJB [Clostridia bacterium]|nr:spore coat protein CotJB [Clostridia bacterium]
MNDDKMNRNELMQKIMENKFAINDMALFLDVNPCSSQALKKHNEYVQNYNKYKERYEKEYGPLSIDSETNSWETWVYDPWPWERSDR